MRAVDLSVVSRSIITDFIFVLIAHDAAKCLEGVLAVRDQPFTLMKMTNLTKITRSNIQRRSEDEKLDFAFP